MPKLPIWFNKKGFGNLIVLGLSIALAPIVGWAMVAIGLIGLAVVNHQKITDVLNPANNVGVGDIQQGKPDTTSINNRLMVSLYKLSDSLGTDMFNVDKCIKQSMAIVSKMDSALLNIVRKVTILARLAQEGYEESKNNDEVQNAMLSLHERKMAIDKMIHVDIPKLLKERRQ